MSKSQNPNIFLNFSINRALQNPHVVFDYIRRTSYALSVPQTDVVLSAAEPREFGEIERSNSEPSLMKRLFRFSEIISCSLVFNLDFLSHSQN